MSGHKHHYSNLHQSFLKKLSAGPLILVLWARLSLAAPEKIKNLVPDTVFGKLGNSFIQENAKGSVAKIKALPLTQQPPKMAVNLSFTAHAVAENLYRVSAYRPDVERTSKALDRHVVDRLAELKIESGPSADEALFLRRVYLDVTGRIPSAAQARSFLDDTRPDKRRLLIDQLLASPEYGDHWGKVWRDWVAPAELPSEGNGGNQPIKATQDLGRWFAEQFNAGQGWDQIVTDLLTVRGELKQKPQAIYFSLVGNDRGEPEPAGIARNIGSLFLGVQLQCAECHDDPFKEWKQTDYWGLAASFRHLGWKFNGRYFDALDEIPYDEAVQGKNNNNNNRNKWKFISDKAPLGSITIPPGALKNGGTIVPARFLQAVVSDSADQTPPLRPKFAEWLTSTDNPYFARAFVNRTWGYLFARGILHPIDDFCSSNDPTHPELLQELTTEFINHGHDIRHLLRCILNSQTYQRTSTAAAQKPSAATTAFARMPVRVMSADQLYESLRLALADPKLDLRAYDERRANSFGESSPVADPYTEFTRLFTTNEEDPADLTHGIPQYLALLNHPRLRNGGQVVAQLQKMKLEPAAAIEELYLGTLARKPNAEEAREGLALVSSTDDLQRGLSGLLWVLLNRSDFLLIQ
jgi:hypothetical protein